MDHLALTKITVSCLFDAHSLQKLDTEENLGHKGIWMSVHNEGEENEDRYKHFWR